jgi:3-methylcrotonyl-CoA carboxylase alpha subunit
VAQEALAIRGHAIEARVYAEDPARDFMPASGTLTHLRQPREVPGRVRVDTGVVQGDQITPHYDPMIAKLIVWGEDRPAALRQLAAALAGYEVVGPMTNLALLRAIAAHPAFAAPELDTGFIARHAAALLAEPAAGTIDAAVLAAAALTVMRDQQAASGAQARATGDGWSPWAAADAWRMNGDGYQDVHLRYGEAPAIAIRAQPRPDGGFWLDLPGGAAEARLSEDEGGSLLRLDGVSRRLTVVRRGEELTVILAGRNHLLVHVDPLAPPRGENAGSERVTAPVPGRVARVMVQPGDAVVKNAPLVMIEAMKMEMTLRAPFDGIIAQIRHVVGDMVEDGTELVTFVAEAPPV